MKTRKLEDLIGQAYLRREGCPPPESFLEERRALLSSEALADLDRHADRCPACAADRDLARSFEPSTADLQAIRDELDPIVASLEATAPSGTDRSVGDVVPLRARQGAKLSRWRGLAAAAVLAVAAVSLWLVSRGPAPNLPPLGSETVFRGTRIDVVRPVGDLSELPGALEWKPVPQANDYLVRILAVDDAVLWESTFSADSADLPPNLLERMHPAVVYIWQVEARDTEGNTLARSERVRFRVRPSTGTN